MVHVDPNFLNDASFFFVWGGGRELTNVHKELYLRNQVWRDHQIVFFWGGIKLDATNYG